MQQDEKYIADVVRRVIDEIEKQSRININSFNSNAGPVFDDVNSAVAASKRAQKEWAGTPKSVKAKIIEELRACMHSYAEDFSRRAVEETGMGRVEDKIIKHHNAATHTPGI